MVIGRTERWEIEEEGKEEREGDGEGKGKGGKVRRREGDWFFWLCQDSLPSYLRPQPMVPRPRWMRKVWCNLPCPCELLHSQLFGCGEEIEKEIYIVVSESLPFIMPQILHIF